MKTGSGISRRNFLVGAGAAVAGSAAMGTGLLAGCAKQEEKESTSQSGAVTLEVLNPRGEVEPIPAVPPNARLDSLDGKTIALYWNSKQNGYVFWDHIKELLERDYPTANVLRYDGGFEISDAMAQQMVDDGVQAFMYGMGD